MKILINTIGKAGLILTAVLITTTLKAENDTTENGGFEPLGGG
jgi:hypothetical protein